MDTKSIKEQVGALAATFVENGMTIGLGTGSTAAYFIKSLADRFHQEKLSLILCATSTQSEELAKRLGLPLSPIDTIQSIDLTFDGADEIDAEKRMIKGGGGALLREKIIASASKELVVLIDDSKYVNPLGKGNLPIEVTPFGHALTARRIKELGFLCTLRKKEDGSLFVTDNDNYIYDILLQGKCSSPEKLDKELHDIPGVVETGFFFGLAGRVIMGYRDGNIRISQREELL